MCLKNTFSQKCFFNSKVTTYVGPLTPTFGNKEKNDTVKLHGCLLCLVSKQFYKYDRKMNFMLLGKQVIGSHAL